MIVKCRGIVFQTHKYSESSVVARIYTSELGLVPFIMNGVRSGKGQIRPSHLMPLNLLELVFNHRQNVQLHRVKELKCDPVLLNLHYDMLKSGIAMFVKEVLNQCVQEEEKNEGLFTFLQTSIQWLDLQQESLGNFPVYFLTRLSRYIGFYPGGEWSEKQVFNLMDGSFHNKQEAMSHNLDEQESKMIYLLREADFDNYHNIQMNPALRKRLLNSLLEYYRIHLHGFTFLHSPDILHEVLSG